jgi:hypothetical protein
MTNELIATLTARDVREQVNLIQEVMKAVMKDGVHYGMIPGCPKPSLFKAGAEKIASTFRITITSEVIDLSSQDEKRYRVTCTAYSLSGAMLGSSVGECSTDEEKYRWRAPVCEEEFEETDSDRKREKWAKGREGAYKKKQIRTEPADLANTILQMADKRAYVSIVRKVTAASDVFTQDIEDLPVEVIHEVVEIAPAGKPDVAPPQQKPISERNGNYISDPQIKRLYAIMRSKGFPEDKFKEWMLFSYNIQSTRDIQRNDYETIVNYVEAYKSNG